MTGVDSGFEVQIVVHRPHHAAQGAQRVRREHVLVGDDSHGFKVVAVLALSGGLLHLLVGNLDSAKGMADNEAETVFRA